MTREPEFDAGQLALLRAYQQNLASMGPHGVEMDVATDPRNAWKFVSKVTTDFAAKTLADDQAAYYKKYDIDPEHPINRAGHLWSVRLDT